MIRTAAKIGPQDQGRRMSLADFDPIAVEEGFIYELSRGIITVSDVPGFAHMRQLTALRDSLILYKAAHPEEIFEVLGTMECKLLIGEFESERHPDLGVYKNEPPRKHDFWYDWVPDIAVEVVSRGSKRRDYQEKSEEYLALGIEEYWIVDAAKNQIVVLRRSRSKWVKKTLRRGDVYETKLLPGFQLDCTRILQAAD